MLSQETLSYVVTATTAVGVYLLFQLVGGVMGKRIPTVVGYPLLAVTALVASYYITPLFF